jgi:hypothetical protein
MGVMPPFPGVAVKVTDEPRQNGFCEGAIVILTGNNGLTDTGYWMLDAGLLVVQVSEEVKVHDTRSPLIGI